MTQFLSYAMSKETFDYIYNLSDDLLWNDDYTKLLVGFRTISFNYIDLVYDFLEANYYCGIRTFKRKNGLIYFVYEYGHCDANDCNFIVSRGENMLNEARKIYEGDNILTTAMMLRSQYEATSDEINLIFDKLDIEGENIDCN